MNQAGIVRRIEDLGRVVIPKEIRRTMQIREDVATYPQTRIITGVSDFFYNVRIGGTNEF